MKDLFPTLLSLIPLAFGVACSSGDRPAAVGDAPWTTTVDSAGDTVQVRIAGGIPASLVRTLVPELTIGAEDGGEEESFGNLVTVLPARDRGLLVYDEQAMAIRLFDSTGAFVRNVGRKGGGPGEYDHVNGISRLPDGRFIAWDASGSRLNAYQSSGEFQTSWRLPFQGFFAQNILWSDSTYHIFAWAMLKRDSTDFTRGEQGVIRLDSAGHVLDSLPFPVWRAPPPSLLARSPDGHGASAYRMPFWPANAASTSPLGGFVSGPGDPYVLYLTGRRGQKPVRIEREYVPVPVSATEREEQKAEAIYGLQQVDPRWSWTVADIPPTKPAYESIMIGLDGRIWVAISTPGVPMAVEELPVPRPGEKPSPRITTREASVYDVFSPQGRLLGRVALPRRTSIQSATGNQVWGVQRDSLDVQYAVRFRVEPALRP